MCNKAVARLVSFGHVKRQTIYFKKNYYQSLKLLTHKTKEKFQNTKHEYKDIAIKHQLFSSLPTCLWVNHSGPNSEITENSNIPYSFTGGKTTVDSSGFFQP